jgi:hypothetical protein
LGSYHVWHCWHGLGQGAVVTVSAVLVCLRDWRLRMDVRLVSAEGLFPCCFRRCMDTVGASGYGSSSCPPSHEHLGRAGRGVRAF